MRNKVIFGNWKLNNDLTETIEFCYELRVYLKNHDNLAKLNKKRLIMGFAPQAPLLFTALEHSTTDVWILAQNVAANLQGAYTGEISPDILLSIGISTVIIGHSERRTKFKETNAIVHRKLALALDRGLNVVLCCGESEKIRNEKKHVEFVIHQLTHALNKIPILKLRNLYIAYEPIWAIGTGKTASAKDAEEMASVIRKLLSNLYTNEMAKKTHILYGGSVKPDNIGTICAKENVDGVLVGGASIKAASYIKLLENC